MALLLVCIIGNTGHTKFAQMMILGWPGPIGKSNSFPNAFKIGTFYVKKNSKAKIINLLDICKTVV